MKGVAIMSLIDEVGKKDGGALFFKADLHIHSPVSKCYNQSEISPRDIVDTAIKNDLSIIAITDHNSEGWFEKVSNEVNDDENLLVLPGVEITTPQGAPGQIHMLAIFNPEDCHKVNELLIKIGISHEKRGAPDAVADKNIPEIMEIINKMDGISILSHVDSNGGLDVELPAQNPTKKKILDSKYLDGVEITEIDTLHNYEDFACIQNSDAHSLGEIGRRYTLIKMGTPSFEGLRQALGDHESRIKYKNDNLWNYPQIVGIKFDGGFLNGQVICFNKSLNCLIGGKGTGKSTIIELIRYGFDMLSDTTKIKDNEEDQIKDVLGSGKLSIIVKTNEGEQYIIERMYGIAPEIFREDGEEVKIEIKRFRDEFFKIEAYSQNELLEIARNFKSQLNMIDQYINIKHLHFDKTKVLSDLAANEVSILEIEGDIDDMESQIGELNLINEKLRILESKGIGEILKDRVFWDDEKRILKNIISQISTEIDNRETNPKTFTSNIEIPKIDGLDNFPNKEQISESLSILSRSKSELDSMFNKEIEILKLCASELEAICHDWGQKYKLNEERLRESLIRLEDESGVKVKDYQEYLKLEQKKKELEDLATKVEEKRYELVRVKAVRREKVGEFAKIKQDIFDIRYNVIKDINESINGFVRIKIDKAADNSNYRDYLVEDALAGNKVRKEQRERIADRISPTELADILERGDMELLIDTASISEKIAKNVIELAKSKLYRIQVTELEDKITIELNDHGWKQISSCSDGQKCTAILSIAMFERDIPLIIDQPEDSLDNAFIYKEVVKNIRGLKNKRQFIVATHNANIPVLGDSELMLVMKSNGINGFVTERGVIDKDIIKKHVQNILEGGKDAFEKRKLKYGI